MSTCPTYNFNKHLGVVIQTLRTHTLQILQCSRFQQIAIHLFSGSIHIFSLDVVCVLVLKEMPSFLFFVGLDLLFSDGHLKSIYFFGESTFHS